MKKITISLLVFCLLVSASAVWARGPGGGGGRGAGGSGWRQQCPNPPCQQLGGSRLRQRKLIRKRQQIHQPRNVPPSGQPNTLPSAGAPQ